MSEPVADFCPNCRKRGATPGASCELCGGRLRVLLRGAVLSLEGAARIRAAIEAGESDNRRVEIVPYVEDEP